MASPSPSPAERAYYTQMQAKINNASKKEVENLRIITELAKKIIDLGGVVLSPGEPDIQPIQRGNPLERKLHSLEQKIQWQEKRIQEYSELMKGLEKRQQFPLSEGL